MKIKPQVGSQQILNEKVQSWLKLELEIEK